MTSKLKGGGVTVKVNFDFQKYTTDDILKNMNEYVDKYEKTFTDINKSKDRENSRLELQCFFFPIG